MEWILLILLILFVLALGFLAFWVIVILLAVFLLALLGGAVPG